MTVANECIRAYQAIRSSLVDYELPPGRQIPVRIIAESLAMSVAPVHTACSRLAAEGWAIPGSKAGYFAWRPEEDVLAALYDYIRTMLTSALHHADVRNPDRDQGQAIIRSLRIKLAEPGLANGLLAAYTGELFLAIVTETGHKPVMEYVRAANERLYYLRILECRHFGDTASELLTHCELVLAGHHDDLQQAIMTYHDRRRNLVPELRGLLAAQ